jgi:hypothetical protein
MERTQPLHLLEELAWRTFQHNLTLGHHNHAIGLDGFVHKMGDGNHGHTLLAMEPVSSLQHLLAAKRVE